MERGGLAVSWILSEGFLDASIQQALFVLIAAAESSLQFF